MGHHGDGDQSLCVRWGAGRIVSMDEYSGDGRWLPRLWDSMTARRWLVVEKGVVVAEIGY